MKWLKIVVFLYITITMYADRKNYTKHERWEQISSQRIFSVSGLVHYKNGFLIVHDNKRDNQPRISFFKNNPEIDGVVTADNISGTVAINALKKLNKSHIS